MALKLFQLNILKGKFLEEILEYVRQNDFDILNFQEVAGGDLSYNRQNDFEKLKEELEYNGVIVKTINPVFDPKTYFGIATLFKQDLEVLDHQVIWLKDFDPNFELRLRVNHPNPNIYNISRAASVLLLKHQGRKFHLINTHLNRGADSKDTEYKLEQARILIDYIKQLKHPYVLTGDFNVDTDTQVIKEFNKIGRNLTLENGIKYTLNPNIHYLKNNPKIYRLAVDFIFINNSIKVKNFHLVTEDLSDHYGLFLEFEI